jgi:hypothetical protein
MPQCDKGHGTYRNVCLKCAQEVPDQSWIGELPPIKVTLTVTVVVTNQKLLWDFARKHYCKTNQTDMRDDYIDQLKVVGLPDAVTEALVLSNMNPAPNEYGIEIDDASAVVTEGEPLTYKGILEHLDRYMDSDADRKDLGIADAEDDQDATPCPVCGGDAYPMGKMGNLQHFRCQQCGADSYQEAS